MPYNLTAFGNATNPFAMIESVNAASGYWLGVLALASIFIIVLTMLIGRNPNPEAFFGASTVTLIASLLFTLIGLTSYTPVVIFTVITAAAGVALYKGNSA